VKIGIDMLAAQSAGRARGTGRYTRALAAELLHDAAHEWFLYYHTIREESGVAWDERVERAPAHDVGERETERRSDREKERGVCPSLSPSISPSLSRSRWAGASEDSLVPPYSEGAKVTQRTLTSDASLHAGIDQLLRTNADGIDVLLLSCPLENFHGYLPPFPRRGSPKLAAIIYDLIPLRFPQQYLAHPGISASYRRALAAIRQYDLLMTISEACRQDVLDLLRVPGDRVVNIGAGSDAGFFHPPRSLSPDDDTRRWLSERQIRQPYVYAMTALDHRKNFAGLLAAFERLPAELLSEYRFAITCAASSDEDAERARALIERSPVAPRVTLTGSLDDAGLRTMYQHAAAFVFPSRYEGFGLPLVEAMQCGAPVVGGRNSSQIEVVGDAGLLADVDQPNSLAEAINRVLTDELLAARCRERGMQRARQFEWPAVATRCRQALQAACNRPCSSTWLTTLAARGRLSLENRLLRRGFHFGGIPA
jgi:glycosyltransferase involved in cell wall biosynthesis